MYTDRITTGFILYDVVKQQFEDYLKRTVMMRQTQSKQQDFTAAINKKKKQVTT